MTKVMIWPDVYREQGHWLPAVNLAKSLQDAGYTVEFMGIPDCKGVVEPYKATFRTILGDIYPEGHTLNDRLEPIGHRWKPHHLLPLSRGALDSIFTGPNKPDLLIAGYFAGLEATILSQKYGVPVVILTTYLRHPDEDPAIFARSKLIHLDEPVAQKIMDQSTGQQWTDLEDFMLPLEDVMELIPCAREFDFYDEDWKHRGSTRYVEPMIRRVPLDGSSLPPNPPPSPDQQWPIPTNKKLIFGTSGSQVADYEAKARELFDGLIGMMKMPNMSEYHLVLAMGEKLRVEYFIKYGVNVTGETNTLPKNVTLSAWVSQLDILKRAEVVFTHGGLATIKESIWEEVPMVIIPHGKDQTDNALRVQQAGLGLVPKEQETSAEVLRKLFTEAQNSKWILGKLKEMKGIFSLDESATQKKSVNLIRTIVPPV